MGEGQVIGAPNHCTRGRGGVVVMRVNQSITVVRIKHRCKGLFSFKISPNSPVKFFLWLKHITGIYLKRYISISSDIYKCIDIFITYLKPPAQPVEKASY